MNLLLKFRGPVLALIAATQIFSPVLVIPGAESIGGSVFRLLLVLVAGILAITSGIPPLSRWPRRAFAAAAMLTFWMIASLIWAADIQAGARQISYVVTVLLLIYVFDLLIRNEKDFLSFVRTIAGLGAGVICVSIYEIQTGNHFFRSSLQELAEQDLSFSYVTQDQAWFTFGNPNDLAVHLALCCFVAIALFGRSKLLNLAIIGYFAVVAYVADALGARIVLGSILLFIVLYVVARLQRRPIAIALLTKITLIGGAAVLVFALLTRADFLDVSTFIRLQLMWSAVEMAFQSLLLGTGVGGFESEMRAGGFVGQTYGFVNPHSGLARILAENGVVGLGLLGFLLFGPVLALGHARAASRVSAFVAGMTVAFPLLFSSGSDPFSSSSLQLAIALLWIGCRFADDNGQAVARPTPVHKSRPAGHGTSSR